MGNTLCNDCNCEDDDPYQDDKTRGVSSVGPARVEASTHKQQPPIDVKPRNGKVAAAEQRPSISSQRLVKEQRTTDGTTSQKQRKAHPQTTDVDAQYNTPVKVQTVSHSHKLRAGQSSQLKVSESHIQPTQQPHSTQQSYPVGAANPAIHPNHLQIGSSPIDINNPIHQLYNQTPSVAHSRLQVRDNHQRWGSEHGDIATPTSIKGLNSPNSVGDSNLASPLTVRSSLRLSDSNHNGVSSSHQTSIVRRTHRGSADAKDGAVVHSWPEVIAET